MGARPSVPASTGPTAIRRLLVRARFWVRRYLLAEIAGIVTLLLSAAVATAWAAPVPVVALVASVGEGIGFYAVLWVVVQREQHRHGFRGMAALARTIGLLLAEFGPAELLDSFLVRPAAMLAGMALLPDGVGLVAGKIVADLVFYALAATAFTVTERTGMRGPGPDAELRERRLVQVRTLVQRGDVAALIREHGTPVLLLEPDAVVSAYQQLRRAFGDVRFHYAVKALDHGSVLDVLAAEGSGFDIASTAELKLLLARGVDPADILHTHPVKKSAEIAEAVAAGVGTFVVDSVGELDKLAGHPVRVLVRLAYRNPAAKSDLSSKFGLEREAAARLVEVAVARGVDVVGFSFHVGSQLAEPQRFRDAVEQTLALMERLETGLPVRFTVLDIGGGLPVAYDRAVPEIEEIATVMRPALDRARARGLQVIAEPGRVLVAEAATLVTSVVGVSDRPDGRWYHLDDGVYGGYSNVIAEAATPLILPVSPVAHGPTAPVTLAGPTCDSADVVARGVPMPPLQPGDLLASPTMGAYTVVTATAFNGRPLTPVAVVAPLPPAPGRVARTRVDDAVGSAPCPLPTPSA